LLSKTAMYLKDYQPEELVDEILSDEEFEKLFNETVDAIELKKHLATEKGNAISAADKIRNWGDFKPSDVIYLRDQGYEFHFYKVDKKTFELLASDEEVKFVRLSDVDKMPTIAVLGKLPPAFQANEFALPPKALAQYGAIVSGCNVRTEECERVITEAAKYLPSFNAQMLKAQNEEEYSSVSNTAEGEEGLIWLSGYLPESEIDRFKELSSSKCWAWAMEDVDDDDEKVPTKVKYNKVTRLMIPVFDILGTVPGYHEYDISFWFLGFFTLFFAMIIGDAGYGVIFLLLAIALHVKGKKLSDLVMLLYVLSVGTIVWGSLTGTWFGLEGAMDIPLLKSLVIPSFANYPEYFGVSTTAQQNAIMKFCFIIGVIQLSLACIMNVRTKLKSKDLSLVADIGWLLAIDALYFIVLFLVIGESVNLVPVAVVVAVGFLLVVCFGGMSPDKTFSQGLKAGLGDAFTTFLNTISAFGNIMSYIRLFAVGMASLAIAQSFNNMAAGFSGPLVIVGAVIMIIGHVLNLVMGLLSVVVHGIRLNLLEFSGQLGMEWSGIAYNPFKKLDKIKK
ncbi:MAG: hypothetical protein Q4E99_05020, partial [Bacillota bacterium]|nr:hypothetical protein [Bacillota bacterium]